MKKLLLIALLVIFSATPALADRGYHRGGGHAGGHGGGWGWRGAWVVPALIGGAIIYDATRPRTIFVEPSPVYVLPAPAYAPATAPTLQPWYFCPGANGYYPQVTNCPTGWQVVPPIPPGASATESNLAPPPVNGPYFAPPPPR